ncbi:HPr family phosphocarrier protein [Exilibacterium tricleocarpae]|uniref:HPr family phosphocarrier protein n=1 Tax=Exilibacterium tricleocarpae TaxID=2591008 RepID=A0A545TSH6_9GAMM|nr:HPr family phosphocarrier protein [Exilibacterium tricleocarpae]TQV80170.1 HPr family phosphocarrier protein [Exilibacterium tricleocarpae]
MIKQRITIINKLGLHARAAAKFAGEAGRFSSRIEAGMDGKMVDGKSVMSLMLLAACQGTELELTIDGHDEQAAWEALASLIGDRFGEGE